MAIDIALIAGITALIGALGALLANLKIKKCHMCCDCIDSDCMPSSKNSSRITSSSNLITQNQ